MGLTNSVHSTNQLVIINKNKMNMFLLDFNSEESKYIRTNNKNYI